VKATDSRPITAFVFGLAPWRGHLRNWLPHHRIYCFNRRLGYLAFHAFCAPLFLFHRNAEVVVWGYKHPDFISTFCEHYGIPLIRIEDGFLRSVALGREGAPPLSLCFDRSGIYFDPNRPSDLERIIETHDFRSDRQLMQRAEDCLKRLLNSRLSKYNAAPDIDIERLYGPKTKRRILVLGQVEGDVSLVKGLEANIDNNELVRIAVRENPQAQVIYKPHPEVLHCTRTDSPQSYPDAVRDICLVLDQDVALANALDTIDHVYTMTSLSGFEALIRGIAVTCLGAPFYAGWGATDDRQACPRRTARRTPLEIFAAAYILYPRYFDPATGAAIELERALECLLRIKMDKMKKTSGSGEP
jgi:capsular polysaccharide export protein